jgi:hypothetical protein
MQFKISDIEKIHFDMGKMDFLEFMWLCNRVNKKLTDGTQQTLISETMGK